MCRLAEGLFPGAPLGLPCEFPGLLRQRTDHLGLRRRKLGRGGAVAHAADDALQDRGEAEEVVGRVDREIGPRIEAGALLPPSTPDVMGLCQNVWISDYTYKAMYDPKKIEVPPNFLPIGPFNILPARIGLTK